MIEKLKWNIRTTTAATNSSPFLDSCSRALCVDDEIVFGREGDKQCIMDFLEKECETGNFSVIPIVGMAGLGKTALARVVFNDEEVCNKFQSRIWISVSMDFDIVRMLRSMIECAKHSRCELSDLNSLQAEVRDILFGRKFLIVLDDYWTENQRDWDIFSSILRFGSGGSKVIVTTRSFKVSSVVSSLEPYRLGILTEEDCWKLIKRRALPNLMAIENFESIGIELGKKCKGLPLVAMTIGSLLRCKSTEEEWRSVLENELWDMQIFHPFMLSYLHLPLHLKKCFAYCSIFPQNYEYKVDKLVLLWMAEGFIQAVGGRRSEDVGNDYFDDLFLRCFFHRYENGSNQKVYKMHELLHDMALLVSKDVCDHLKSAVLDCSPLFGSGYHLSLIHDGNGILELKASQKNERLRTFILMRTNSNEESEGKIDSDLFSFCKSLRVLDLSNLGTTDLSDSFGELEYVRYINLSGNCISQLPDDICKFIALQTLKLKNCYQLLALPDDMKNLSSLRHLELDVLRSKLLQMLPEFGRLIALQTLSIYVIGLAKGHRIEELKNLNSLRGELCIKNIKFVLDPMDAVEAKLEMKSFLDKLELHWGNLIDGTSISEQVRIVQAQVLANLRPHENLKELVIRNYYGTDFPDWLSEPWRKFTRIDLYGLRHCHNLPPLGKLPFLKYFNMSDLPSLESVGDEFYDEDDGVKFPSLEFFELSVMPMLENWEYESNSAMPCLTAFRIKDCPNLISLPPKLQSLLHNSDITDCPGLQQ